MHIAIIGAGIGGLTAAACLLKAGHSVRVYEQSPQLGEVGAGIQCSSNAVKVLDYIGLRSLIEPLIVRPLAFEFRRYDSGELLHSIPLGSEHEKRHGAPYFQIHRGDLHNALQTVVTTLDPDTIRVGAKAVSVQEDAQGATVTFADGSMTFADLIVGADGIKSVIRQHVIGSDAPVFTGQVAWRCVVPTKLIPPELLTDMVSTVWCGPKNHAVTYYLRGG